MTRRGSPEERDWRRRRNLEPGSDGSIHGEQPVDPRGRKPREKPSGHRHDDPQPAKVHDNAKHDPPMVENAGGSPQSQRGTRAAQPSPGTVPVGSRYIVSDEANLHEVAVDSDSDGTADSWEPVSATEADHGNERHTPNMVENLVGTPSMRRGTRADQPVPGNVTAGSRYTVLDESYAEEVAVDTTGTYDDVYSDLYEGEPDSWVPVTDASAARDPHDDAAHVGSTASDPHSDAAHSRDYDADFVNATGDTMTGRLRVDNSVGLIVADGNGTQVARIDTPEANRSRWMARDTDGSLSPSFIDLRNSSHAGGARTRIHGAPIELRSDVTFPNAVVVNLGDNRIRNMAAPSDVQDAVNKSYADSTFVDVAGDTMTGPLGTTHGFVPTQFTTASDSRQQNIDNSDFQADGTSDDVTIQNAIDALPVGTK